MRPAGEVDARNVGRTSWQGSVSRRPKILMRPSSNEFTLSHSLGEKLRELQKKTNATNYRNTILHLRGVVCYLLVDRIREIWVPDREVTLRSIVISGEQWERIVD